MPGTYISPAETGFYYVSSRYYDAEIGRFINADSAISGTGESVQGYNLYAYCFNNPVNMEDPTGNWPKWVNTIVNTVKKTVNKIKNTIKKSLGIAIQVDKEEPVKNIDIIMKYLFSNQECKKINKEMEIAIKSFQNPAIIKLFEDNNLII